MTIRKITRTIELTIEQSERVFVQSRPALARLWCPLCRQAENFAAPETIARQFNIRQRRIFRFVEAGSVSFREFSEGILLICRQCVARSQNRAAGSRTIE